MTRQPHDDLAKNYLCNQGERFGGTAQSDRRVTSEVRQIDVFFEPEPSALRNSDRRANLALRRRSDGARYSGDPGQLAC